MQNGGFLIEHYALCTPNSELERMDAEMDLAEDLARAAELARCALKRAEANGVGSEERGYARDGFYVLVCQLIGPPSRLLDHDHALDPDPSTVHALTLQKLWERN